MSVPPIQPTKRLWPAVSLECQGRSRSGRASLTSGSIVPSTTCLIDEFGPLAVEQPESSAQLGELTRSASAQSLGLYPLGGQTNLALGNAPTKPGWAVDLSRLNHVLDYPARDMTITIQSGITLAVLQKLLATENQRLPIDVPLAERATLGGALAANTSGPRRYGFGTLRDYVIGISVINDDGQLVKAGGRVVKNVAGYDLCKLHIGALGTLGIITQITLKLRPRPEEHGLIVIPCADETVEGLLQQVHASRTRPVCIDLLNERAARLLDARATAPWHLVVGYEDNRDALTWQVQQLVRELQARYELDARVGFPAEPLWQRLVELPAFPDAALTFKANLLPSALAGFCLAAARLPVPLLLQAHAGSGISVGHVTAEIDAERAASLMQTLRELANCGAGQVVVVRCPTAWKQAISVWGPPRGDRELMRRVKDQIDPRRLFNPGRFVDGI